MTLIQDPIKILKNMRTITRNEALKRGGYLQPDVRPDMADSICGGHLACAVGSLWLAAGVMPEYGDYRNELELPGTEYQTEFVEDKPALKTAFDAMNRAADEYIEENGINRNHLSLCFVGRMEQLFEARHPQSGVPLIEESEFLPIIDRAMEIVANNEPKPVKQADKITNVRVDHYDDTVTITFEDGSQHKQEFE